MARKALHAAGNASGRKRDFEGQLPEAHHDVNAAAIGGASPTDVSPPLAGFFGQDARHLVIALRRQHTRHT